MTRRKRSRKATIARHSRDCRVCNHPQRERIEEDFVAWESPSRIIKQYRIKSRNTLYLHARAFDLLAERNRNLGEALARIVEKGANCRVTAGVVVAAATLLSRLNGRGQMVSRTESESLNTLFDRMSAAEMETYATTGKLPSWFEQELRGTNSLSLSAKDVN
jgi:hypothetical protein